MSVLTVIKEARGGQLVTSLSAAAGLSLQHTIESLDLLVPEIAGRIRETAEQSPEEMELLRDIIDDNTLEDYLDSPRFALGRAAAKDGEETLENLYGSLDAARTRARSIGAPDGVDRELFAQMMTFAATLTLAGLARRNRQAFLAETGDSGIIGIIVQAILKGLLDGLKRAVRPRGRRRRPYSKRRSRRKKRSTRSRRRRKRKQPSLQDLIGDLFR